MKKQAQVLSTEDLIRQKVRSFDDQLAWSSTLEDIRHRWNANSTVVPRWKQFYRLALGMLRLVFKP